MLVDYGLDRPVDQILDLVLGEDMDELHPLLDKLIDADPGRGLADQARHVEQPLVGIEFLKGNGEAGPRRRCRLAGLEQPGHASSSRID